MDALLPLSLAAVGAALVVSVRLALRRRERGLWLLPALISLAFARGVLRALEVGPSFASVDAESAYALVFGLLGLAALAVVDVVLNREARARRASERRLEAALDASVEAAWSLDRSGRTVDVDPALAKMLRRDARELLGTAFLDHVAASHVDEARAEIVERLPEGRATTHELPLVRSDGTTFRASLSLRSLFDDRGRFEGALAMISDLSRTRRVETLQRGRDRVLERIARDDPLDTVLEAICTTTRLAFPGSWVGVLRVASSGEGADFVAGPDVPPRFRELGRSTDRSLEDGSPTTSSRERTHVTPDVRTDPAWADRHDLADACGVRASWSTPIRSAEGAWLGALQIYHDAPRTPDSSDLEVLVGSAQLAAIAIESDLTHRELERLQATLLASIEQSPAGIAIADAREGRVRVANSRALGVSRGSKIENPDVSIDELPLGWDCLHPDGTHLLPEDLPLRRAVREGRTTRNQEMLLRRGDGLKRWILASAAPVRDADGRITAGILVLLDISERKRDDRDMARILRSLGERKEELESIFRATSHDLRAPLVNIEGFARELEVACGELRRLLHGAPLDPELSAELRPILDVEIPLDLDYIRGSAQRMERLLTSLRRLIGVDRLELRIENVDAAELVGQVLKDFRFQLREAEFEVVVGSLPRCRTDRNSLEQVFSNLVDNAIKYRDPERPARLEIEGRTREGRSTYAFVDAGIGIAPEAHDRIFSPFRRYAPVGVHGDGLGLAVLGRLLARLGGRVEVQSEIGAGSRFEVSVPAARTEPDPGDREPAAGVEGRFDGS